MFARLSILAAGLIGVAMVTTGTAKTEQAGFLGRKESWDYGPAMRAVAKRFTGVEGVVLHLGDSIT